MGEGISGKMDGGGNVLLSFVWFLRGAGLVSLMAGAGGGRGSCLSFLMIYVLWHLFD